MCGIGGFCDYTIDYRNSEPVWFEILNKMNRAQKHRGPDEEGMQLSSHCGLAHVRLSILDLQTGRQPMTRQWRNGSCSIVFNGEIYNMQELKEELTGEGIEFYTTSDTEVILAGYLLHGKGFVEKLNGVFAYAIWDEGEQKLLLFRDRLGVKPLFFTKLLDVTVFSSEIKGLLQFPGMETMVDKEGLCEVFGLGPAKTPGKGVFKDVKEVLPGHCMEIAKEGMRTYPYWQLKSYPHEDSYEETVEKTEYFVTDAIKKQMLSDVPICTFLSGGIDSSLVTSICSAELKKKAGRLATYSFDFVDNAKHFQANDFQPSEDRPFAELMRLYADTDHQYLECANTELYGYLYEAVRARDLPCMADIEASLLYFCNRVAKEKKVVLTGECADEIFGGYPWFHKKECLQADLFPWSMDFASRTMLLKDEVLRELPLEEYARSAYEKTIAETPALTGENTTEKRRREIAYLNLRWFMQTLLDRMDRASMHTGLEARVPFADHRIVEYVFNVPWEMKSNGGVKGLLRAAGKKYLPQEVLERKKSPYPKTYDPAYEARLKQEITELLHDTNAPIQALLDKKKVEAFLRTSSDYGRPFYGQLMAGPQLLAYMLQVNYWLGHYQIRLV